MGSTIWVLEEDQEEDDWDHSLLLANEKAINELCKSINRQPFSEYLDFSIEQEDFGLECEPRFWTPDDLASLFNLLLNEINSDQGSSFQDSDGLLEELEDCLFKIKQAKASGKKLRLAVIP